MLTTYMHVADAGARVEPHEVLTLTLSSLHVSKPDIERIRTFGWPLPYEITGHRIELTLPQTIIADGQHNEFLVQLCMLGYSRYTAELVRWACEEGFRSLLLDDYYEPNDRLPIFVG